MPRAEHLPDLASLNHCERFLQAGPPRKRPVDHEQPASRPRNGGIATAPSSVDAIGFSTITCTPAFAAITRQVGAGGVVGIDIDGIQFNFVQHVRIGIERLRATGFWRTFSSSSTFGSAAATSRPSLVAPEADQILPYMVMGQPRGTCAVVSAIFSASLRSRRAGRGKR